MIIMAVMEPGDCLYLTMYANDPSVCVHTTGVSLVQMQMLYAMFILWLKVYLTYTFFSPPEINYFQPTVEYQTTSMKPLLNIC